MSTLISWLIAGIKLPVQIIVITWATLAIYFSNLPLPALRLGLTLAFAAFAIWAFLLSHQRRVPAVAIALGLRRLLCVLGPLWLVLDKNLSGRTPTQITRPGLA